MKIINENIDNFKEAEPLTNVVDAVTAEAIGEDEKVQEATKELIDPEELAKKEPFIGAEKQETPKEIPLPKITLDESLFDEHVELTEDVTDIRRDVEELIKEKIEAALDNIAMVAASEIPEYEADWCLETPEGPEFFKESQALNALVDAEVDLLFAEAPIDESIEQIIKESFDGDAVVEEIVNEADGRNWRAPNKTAEEKAEEDTLFDRVYKELSTDDFGYEVPAKHRFNADVIEVWGEDDGTQELTVRVPEHRKDRLQLVDDVAKHFGLLSRIEKGNSGTYVGTIFIPEELVNETSEETAARLGHVEEPIEEPIEEPVEEEPVVDEM